MEKLYHVHCQTGYALLDEDPPKLDTQALYRVLAESIHHPHCFVIERRDKGAYGGHQTWIVHSDSLEPAPLVINTEYKINNYPGEGKRYYVRTNLGTILDNDVFEKIITKMGGYVYNTVVGRLENNVIFNGYTWASFETHESFERSETLLNQFMAIAEQES